MIWTSQARILVHVASYKRTIEYATAHKFLVTLSFLNQRKLVETKPRPFPECKIVELSLNSFQDARFNLSKKSVNMKLKVRVKHIRLETMMNDLKLCLWSGKWSEGNLFSKQHNPRLLTATSRLQNRPTEVVDWSTTAFIRKCLHDCACSWRNFKANVVASLSFPSLLRKVPISYNIITTLLTKY